MTSFSKVLSIRWADIDANFHLRHSVYYDFGSQLRVELLAQLGLTLQVMQEQHFGPVIFREECVFRKEIKIEDTITLHAKVAKLTPDASRWTIVHEFVNAEGFCCAVLTIDGAWIDTQARKLAKPTPQIAIDALAAFTKTDDFVVG